MCLLLPHPSTELISVKLKSCARLKESSQLLLSLPPIFRHISETQKHSSNNTTPCSVQKSRWESGARASHAAGMTDTATFLRVYFMYCVTRCIRVFKQADFHTDLHNSLTQPTLDSRFQFPPIKIPRKFSFIIVKSIKTYYHFPGASIKIWATHRSCENMHHSHFKILRTLCFVSRSIYIYSVLQKVINSPLNSILPWWSLTCIKAICSTFLHWLFINNSII